MRDWSLRAGDPLSLTISADVRLGTPDYVNDHSWVLELGSGEPPSLGVRTTFGLRARNMRLFFRFVEAGRVVIDPAEFHKSPRVRRFFPNRISVDFVPFEDLTIAAEFWVAGSHVLAGRLTLLNDTGFPRRLGFELCGLLNASEGSALAVSKHQMVSILSGRTGGLEPVVFLSGGPQQGSGPHPSLGLGIDLGSNTKRTLTWAVAAEATAAASFALARRTAGRAWDAEMAHIERINARDTVEIYTGDPDWDAVLALSQSAAFRHLLPGSQHLPRASLVRLRGPDDGYSQSGNGSDYPPAWSGQSAFDAWYLAGTLPGAPDLTRGLLENFLSVQAADGTIDAKPGLAGQRSEFLAAPMLASMAWRHNQLSANERFLTDSFPKLLAFFNVWFAPAHDPDGDGIPQWQHVLQTGFEQNPLFDVWNRWSQAVGIENLFSPQLESLLYREARCLMLMAEQLGRGQELAELRERTPALVASVAAAWNRRISGYTYRDRSTGVSSSARLVGSRKGSGEILPRQPDCKEPARLLIQVQTKSAASTRPSAGIFGHYQSSAGSVDLEPHSERIAPGQFQWRTGGLVATSQSIYGTVERVTIDGLAAQDRAIVRTVGSAGEDVTLFTPLWAQLPDPARARAMALRLLRDQRGFDRPHGIPALPALPTSARHGTRDHAEADALAMSVHMPWNTLIGEGLLAYGMREEAAQLISRLMSGIMLCLRQSRAFYERYHALTGSGLGERGALTGLAPVGLFLETLGVRILSPTSVRLEGKNCFPWPVTVIYRGMKIIRGIESTLVIFPNAESVTITDTAVCVVSG